MPPQILLGEDHEHEVEITFSASELRITNPDPSLFFADSSPLPAVLMADLKMPRVDLPEVLRTIKSNSILQTIPVVRLITSQENRDLIRRFQVGVNAQVVMPVNFAQFNQSVLQLAPFWATVNESTSMYSPNP